MPLIATLLERLFPADKQPTQTRDSQSIAANKAQWAKVAKISHSPVRRRVTITKIIDETPTARSIVFTMDDAAPLTFCAGQFITCCFNIDGHEHRRAFSLSSAPETQQYQITVKRINKGKVSSFIHQQLVVGDVFFIWGPSGDFIVPEQAEQCVFITAGSGITPVKSQIDDLTRHRDCRHLTLIHCSRDVKQAIFHKPLSALNKQYPSFKYHLVTSHTLSGQPSRKGRLSPERLTKLVTDFSTPHFFVCGPASFNQWVNNFLVAKGVANQKIHTEHFIGAPRKHAPHPTTPQQIRFSKSGQTVIAQPGQSILEAGLAAGVPLAYSCQMGGCGHCRIKVTEGHVISDQPNCLSDDETAQGYRLACLSYPCTATQIEA